MSNDFQRFFEHIALKFSGRYSGQEPLEKRIAELARNPEEGAAFYGLSAQISELRSLVDRVRRELEFVRHYRSNYLGDGVSVVWLPDDTIMYVNSNDEGGPSALISGGRYEEDYFSVFRSFLTDSSQVLDIGANLGIYALRTAQHFRNSAGRVFAFEPHPTVCDLLRRSVMHNGLQGRIDVRQIGLSDRAADVTLYYPARHIGGGGYTTPDAHSVPVNARLEVADQQIPDRAIDLVKMDVEGNELSVLRGMSEILARSPRIAILFEKLQSNGSDDTEQFGLLNGAGLQIYAIEGGARLRPLDQQGYRDFGGYMLAARSSVVGSELDRRFFEISWRQMHFVGMTDADKAQAGVASGWPGQVLFHGPYWFLGKGRYRLTLTGEIDAPIDIVIAEQFGVEVTRCELTPGQLTADFEAPYDLRKFECVARARDGSTKVTVEKLRLTQF